MSRSAAIFLMGETASGKSELALHLAEKFGFEIVNCDSIQLYQKLDIGSSKPSQADRERVVHHLYDYIAPPDECTAGRYRKDVLNLLEEFPEKSFVFTGGTGFYFQALEKGMYPSGQGDEQVRQRLNFELEQRGLAALYGRLEEKDPEYAKQIHSNDSYRILRGLEMMEVEQKSVSQIRSDFQQQPFPRPILKLVVRCERPRLQQRVSQRTQAMLERGWMDEVRGLLDLELQEWAPLSSVGYREVVDHLQGRLPQEDLAEKINVSTMQLAKRQRTWFKRDSTTHSIWREDSPSWLRDAESLTGEFVGRILRL